jgi:hypothetical protein
MVKMIMITYFSICDDNKNDGDNDNDVFNHTYMAQKENLPASSTPMQPNLMRAS